MWEVIIFFYIEAATPEKPEKRGLSCSRAREVPPKTKKQMLVKTGPKLTSLLCQSTKHPN